MEGGAARGWVVRPCYGSGAKPRPIEPPCTALLFARDLNAHWRLGLPSPLLRFQEPLQGPVKLFLQCPVVSEDLVHVTFLRKSTCSMVIIRFFLEHQTMQHSKQRDSLSGTLLLVHRVAPALRSSPQHFLYDFARRSTHLRVPNLLASDQTTVDSLP